MTINIVRPVRYTEDPDLQGGPNGYDQDFILLSGTADLLLLSEGNETVLDQSNEDDILLSSHNCVASTLLSGTTDVIILSGTTDELLLTGYCTSSLLDSGFFIEVNT